MATITKIARQKQRPDRYSIFVDGKFSFGLTDLELSTSGLREGAELAEEEVEQWQGQAQQSKAYDRAINYLSFRQRSAREISDYLIKKDFAPEQIKAVVGRLQQAGLISDAQFAASWVADRQATNPRSKRRLQQELRTKGLDADVIEHALAEVSPEDERTAITRIAQKKLTQSKFRQDQRKLISYLVGQGFSYSAVRTVLEELGGSEQAIS